MFSKTSSFHVALIAAKNQYTTPTNPLAHPPPLSYNLAPRLVMDGFASVLPIGSSLSPSITRSKPLPRHSNFTATPLPRHCHATATLLATSYPDHHPNVPLCPAFPASFPPCDNRLSLSRTIMTIIEPPFKEAQKAEQRESGLAFQASCASVAHPPPFFLRPSLCSVAVCFAACSLEYEPAVPSCSLALTLRVICCSPLRWSGTLPPKAFEKPRVPHRAALGFAFLKKKLLSIWGGVAASVPYFLSQPPPLAAVRELGFRIS